MLKKMDKLICKFWGCKWTKIWQQGKQLDAWHDLCDVGYSCDRCDKTKVVKELVLRLRK